MDYLIFQNFLQKLCANFGNTAISSKYLQNHRLEHAKKQENGGLTLLAKESFMQKSIESSNREEGSEKFNYYLIILLLKPFHTQSQSTDLHRILMVVFCFEDAEQEIWGSIPLRTCIILGEQMFTVTVPIIGKL